MSTHDPRNGTGLGNTPEDLSAMAPRRVRASTNVDDKALAVPT